MELRLSNRLRRALLNVHLKNFPKSFASGGYVFFFFFTLHKLWREWPTERGWALSFQVLGSNFPYFLIIRILFWAISKWQWSFIAWKHCRFTKRRKFPAIQISENGRLDHRKRNFWLFHHVEFFDVIRVFAIFAKSQVFIILSSYRIMSSNLDAYSSFLYVWCSLFFMRY